MKLSACWIVKDEAKNIAASILSVRGCVDELLVVDTGSTDATPRIARECGAKVLETPWNGDFSAARNFALERASGEIVVFIDADEYFDPPLSLADGENLATALADADVLQFRRIEVERENGGYMGETLVNRVLRRETVRYVGRIHESPLRIDGKSVVVASSTSYNLYHTGYSSDVRVQKEERNVEILEDERISLEDEFKKFKNAAYLMREHFSLGNDEKAGEYCRYILKNAEHFAYACEVYGTAYLPQLYCAIRVCAKRRAIFSAEELYAPFKAMKENFADTRDAALADAFHQLVFDYSEDRFLREVAALEPKLEARSASEVLDCRAVEAEVFTRAAEAVLHGTDTDKTFRWAMRAMRNARLDDDRQVKLILHCMKANTAEEIALFLRELFDLTRPNVAAAVAKVLTELGLHDVYRLLM